MGSTYHCTECGSRMEPGKTAPITNGYVKAYECTNCNNTGSVRSVRRTKKIRGMTEQGPTA